MIVVITAFDCRNGTAPLRDDYRIPLSFLDGPSRFRAAVAAREFFNAASRIDKLLFTGEKRMASGADADSNVRTCRAGMVDRTARTDDVAFLIIRMNARFHGREGVRNLSKVAALRKG
jgi:hypothetical protein